MALVRNSADQPEIVYRFTGALPVRWVPEGEEAEASLTLEEDEITRWVLFYRRSNWVPSQRNHVAIWTERAAAEEACRTGFTVAFTAGIAGIFRPLIRAGLAAVVIGPHNKLLYLPPLPKGAGGLD